MDISAARAALRILNQERALAILPEATRSPSGEILPFTPGFVKVAIRAQAPVVPAVIVGSWHVWPKHKTFPRPGRISIAYGKPMDLVEAVSSKGTLDLEKALGEKARSRVPSLAESLQGGYVEKL